MRHIFNVIPEGPKAQNIEPKYAECEQNPHHFDYRTVNISIKNFSSIYNNGNNLHESQYNLYMYGYLALELSYDEACMSESCCCK